jgi:hypothetical protein
MIASSTRTTKKAIVIAAWNLGIRNGSVWPIPPRAVMAPQTNPRTQGWPLPVRLPSSDSASAKPMLIPAPSDAANPTRNASQEFRVARAAANTGASVDTEPSMSPARPGCTICKTKSRRRALSSSSLTFGAAFLPLTPAPDPRACVLPEPGHRAVGGHWHLASASRPFHKIAGFRLRLRWPASGPYRGRVGAPAIPASAVQNPSRPACESMGCAHQTFADTAR